MPNCDETTGIRYGVISPHSISSFAIDDIYNEGTDPHYEAMRQDILTSVSDFAGRCGYSIPSDLQEEISDLIIDRLSDGYENSDGQMDYSDQEYDLHVSGDNFGIFVMKSPYYTYCRGCSPCALGAGDLNSPIEKDPDYPDANKALCLGHEWFDQDNDQYSRKIPYRVFRVSDDSEVLPGDQP